MFHFFIIKHHNYFIIIIISYYILFNFITFYWILLWIMCFYYMIMITLWCVYGVNYEIETSGCSHQFETRDLTLALAKSLTYLCVVVTIIFIHLYIYIIRPTSANRNLFFFSVSLEHAKWLPRVGSGLVVPSRSFCTLCSWQSLRVCKGYIVRRTCM